MELKDLQNERCPRISANDVIAMNSEQPQEIAVIDLRSHLEFNRAHLKDSINIPFSSISLGDIRLEALNVPDLEARLANRVVVIASNSHENAILVSYNHNKMTKTKRIEITFIFSLLTFYWTVVQKRCVSFTMDSISYTHMYRMC